ncbi:MAG: hypothetical protein ACTSPI_00815 [Candidatus Heimdallarchaeaceae archaeon]
MTKLTKLTKLQIEMEKDKETKGAVRYSDKGTPYPKSIYLRKEEAEVLGNPNKILVKISPIE